MLGILSGKYEDKNPRFSRNIACFLHTPKKSFFFHIGSHNKSFKGIVNCFAKARVASYEIAHLNIGGPSNRSLGEVRKSNLIDVSSIICRAHFVQKAFLEGNEGHTAEKTPTRFISISVNSPGILN